MSTRVQDWPEQLAAWVVEHRARPHAWGEWDCARAANDCVARITGGADRLAGLEWSDLRSALRLLEREGGLEAAVTARMGEPILATFAQRGDVVLIDITRVPPEHATVGALGICLGEVACAPSAAGLVFVPMFSEPNGAGRAGGVICAWPVGR
jgi:hypothetical protein